MSKAIDANARAGGALDGVRSVQSAPSNSQVSAEKRWKSVVPPNNTHTPRFASKTIALPKRAPSESGLLQVIWAGTPKARDPVSARYVHWLCSFIAASLWRRDRRVPGAVRMPFLPDPARTGFTSAEFTLRTRG